MNDVIQLNVSLDKSDPIIWRRILIPDSITFFDLHHVLQIVMGWKNSHLFEFIVNDYRIGFVDGDNEGYEDMAEADLITVDTLLSREGLQFKYRYDFGDGWEHSIQIEKIIDSEPGKVYPVCIEGKMNCPPENCGGISGFYNMLEILNDKDHPEFEDMHNWAGRYNPKKFNLIRINKEMPRFRTYMKHWKK